MSRAASPGEFSVHPRVVWTALTVSAGLALVVCYAVGSQQLLLGDRHAGWLYPYIATFGVRSIGVALIAAAIATTMLAVLPRPDERNEWLVVGAWIVVGLVLQLLVRSLGSFSMTHVLLSDDANAFYRVTQITDLGSVLAEFGRARSDWPLHAQSNMPGKIMLLFALEVLSSRPAFLTWSIVALSSVGGALMYVFVRNLFGDKAVGLFSLILYLFVPARLFFLPLLNTVTPVMFLACACLVLRWLQTGNQWYAAAAGLAVYGLVFFEPLPLVMGVLFIALIARSVVRRERLPSRLAIDTVAGALAFMASYLAMLLVFDFDLFDALRRITEHAVEFNVNEGRPYAYWLSGNLREFAFGIGMGQAILFVVSLFSSLGAARTQPGVLLTPIGLLSTSLALILLITNLLGVNRGEVIRLWIFLACFFQIPAAYLCARLDNRFALILVLSMTILQAAIAMAMIGFVVLP